MWRKRAVFLSLLFYLSFLFFKVNAQEPRERFLEKPVFYKAEELKPARVAVVAGGIGLLYGSALVGLNEYWYKNYERTNFHFFNDALEWRGMDKAGHIFNSYYQSRYATGMFRWTGMNDRRAIWFGGMSGIFLQSSIEILDGFSAKWGASVADFGANMLGSALVISQELAWREQRIMIKISAHPKNYAPDVEYRAKNLFGSSFGELIVKDYNAITLWSSVNIHSFLKNKQSRFPKWLNVSVGYGAEGLFGGFENKWCEDPTSVEFTDHRCQYVTDRSDIERYSQFYLSFDVDFTRIKTKNPVVYSLLAVLNLIKVPAPALEVNTKGGVRFHPLYF